MYTLYLFVPRYADVMLLGEEIECKQSEFRSSLKDRPIRNMDFFFLMRNKGYRFGGWGIRVVRGLDTLKWRSFFPLADSRQFLSQLLL